MKRISVLLIDDHSFFRSALRSWLQAEPHFQVIGEAPDGRKGVSLAAERCPHLAVVDFALQPDFNGLETMKKLRQHCPGIKVLMLTLSQPEDYCPIALQAGADACISKLSLPDEFFGTVRALMSGA